MPCVMLSDGGTRVSIRMQGGFAAGRRSVMLTARSAGHSLARSRAHMWFIKLESDACRFDLALTVKACLREYGVGVAEGLLI